MNIRVKRAKGRGSIFVNTKIKGYIPYVTFIENACCCKIERCYYTKKVGDVLQYESEYLNGREKHERAKNPFKG